MLLFVRCKNVAAEAQVGLATTLAPKLPPPLSMAWTKSTGNTGTMLISSV
jgi:hypothetical protein